MNKKISTLISFSFGFICLLLTAFENAYGILAATLLESSILAGGTWILLDKLKNKEGRTPVILIVSSIIAGALSVPIVLFIMDWILQNPNSGLHWGNWMICSGSVILMGCCYKERRLSVYIYFTHYLLDDEPLRSSAMDLWYQEPI